MSSDPNIYFLRVALPNNWALPPEYFSVSTLLQIEACPRKWSLSNSHFNEFGDRNGYPEKPSIPLIKGRIIHKCLETLTHHLKSENCNSLSDPLFVSIMRRIGGYSQLVSDATNLIIESYSKNPRAVININHISQRIKILSPEIRSGVQSLISKSEINAIPGSNKTKSTSSSNKKMPLSSGMHTEVKLTDGKRWKGIVDVLGLMQNRCIIKDYKSGKPKDNDIFQIKTYAWLWYSDNIKNPSKTLPDELVLLYPDKCIEVNPISISEISEFTDNLYLRTNKAISSITKDPPPAFVSNENCSNCTVRHLCAEYWEMLETNNTFDISSKNIDIQVKIKKRRGPKSWDVVIDSCNNHTLSGEAVLINQNNALFNKLDNNITIRVLDAFLAKPIEQSDLPENTKSIFITNLSEIFVLS